LMKGGGLKGKGKNKVRPRKDQKTKGEKAGSKGEKEKKDLRNCYGTGPSRGKKSKRKPRPGRTSKNQEKKGPWQGAGAYLGVKKGGSYRGGKSVFKKERDERKKKKNPGSPPEERWEYIVREKRRRKAQRGEERTREALWTIGHSRIKKRGGSLWQIRPAERPQKNKEPRVGIGSWKRERPKQKATALKHRFSSGCEKRLETQGDKGDQTHPNQEGKKTTPAAGGKWIKPKTAAK